MNENLPLHPPPKGDTFGTKRYLGEEISPSMPSAAADCPRGEKEIPDYGSWCVFLCGTTVSGWLVWICCLVRYVGTLYVRVRVPLAAKAQIIKEMRP